MNLDELHAAIGRSELETSGPLASDRPFHEVAVKLIHAPLVLDNSICGEYLPLTGAVVDDNYGQPRIVLLFADQWEGR